MDCKAPEIVFTETGPYTVVDVPEMETLKGEKLPVRRVMLLCRCGESKKKPFCDGSHERVHFKAKKRPKSGNGRAKSYVGEHITIHFNLRVCSHAGVCFMKLPTVFDREKRPWINPDGASPQEIIDLIHRCPSGALSYSRGIDSAESRERPPKIVVIDNGPFNIQGGIRLRDEVGTEPYQPEHYCLCRCGKSRNEPFCDGSHLEPEDREFFAEDYQAKKQE